MSGVKFIQLNVNNILNFSRVQTDSNKAVNLEFFILTNTLDTITDFLQEMANMKHVLIEMACNVFTQIKADQTKI